jgi:hypothetical protein
MFSALAHRALHLPEDRILKSEASLPLPEPQQRVVFLQADVAELAELAADDDDGGAVHEAEHDGAGKDRYVAPQD